MVYTNLEQRIDPAELEGLKEELRTVQARHDEVAATLTEREKTFEEQNAQLEKKEQEKAEVATLWREKLNKLVTDTKQRLADRRKQLDENAAKITGLNGEIESLKGSLATVIAERDQAVSAANDAPGESAGNLDEERAKWEQEKAELVTKEEEQNARLQEAMQELVSTMLWTVCRLC